MVDLRDTGHIILHLNSHVNLNAFLWLWLEGHQKAVQNKLLKGFFSFSSLNCWGGGKEIDDLINECFGYKETNQKKANQGLKFKGIQL